MKMSRIIRKLRKEEEMSLALVPDELRLPEQLREDTIAQATRHIDGMVQALREREILVQSNLNALNEEMRQIRLVLNYTEPALLAISEGGQ